MIPIPKEKFKIVYADPAWSYYNKNTGGSLKSGANAHYQTMTTKDIMDLPVQEISNKECVLFLWVPCPLMKEGIQVMETWGFTYKTKIYWRKIMSLGMGFWFRGQVEELWIGIKGNIKAFRCQKANFIQSKVRKHSQKPDEAYGIIEEISRKNSLNPKIELFARERREGWSCWGNQLPKTTQKILEVT